MILETRCRAKLHGVFKNSQGQSRHGRLFFLSGGSDQLVGNQIARLASLGVVILSEVLSPGFDLNSPIVRNVLRGWNAHGDAAAMWMTQPLALSTASCLLERRHQAIVVGFFAGLSSNTTCQSLVHCANSSFAFQQVPMDMCTFGLPFRKRFTLFSVNAPIHMKLARRCDDHGDMYSFTGKARSATGVQL